MSAEPKPIEQALADFRAERDRKRLAAEEKAEAQRQARILREIETASRASTWLAREYGVSVPVKQIECSEIGKDAGYELEIRAAGNSGRVRLNGLLSWTADDSLIVSTLYGLEQGLLKQKGNQATWHASHKGTYIDAAFLEALDYAFPWPAPEAEAQP